MGRGEFAVQFRSVYGRLWVIAAGIVGDRTEADDIVQEAAIVALRKLDQFALGSNFSAWLSEIVRRCASNHERKMRKRGTFATDPQSLDNSPAAEQKNVPVISRQGDLLDNQSEFDDQLIRALNSLSAEARCCLLLRTVEQLSYAEIAKLMEIPEGTAMSHVHRSRTTLRRHFEQSANSRKVGERA